MTATFDRRLIHERPASFLRAGEAHEVPMRQVSEQALACKPSRVPTPEQVAFMRGANGLPCVYGAGHLRRAWTFGVRYGELKRSGLRPLDTARRLP